MFGIAATGKAPHRMSLESNLCPLEMHRALDQESGCQAEHSPNRDVLALTLLKASGSLVWAAADVLNVRFAELPEMQGLGDSAFTLGLFFASVGAACFVGKSFSALRCIARSTIANGTPRLLCCLLQVPLSSTGSPLQSEPHNPWEAATP